MAKLKWVIKPQGENEIVIKLPGDVEWNSAIAEISAGNLLRALAEYVADQHGDKGFDCSCNIKVL